MKGEHKPGYRRPRTGEKREKQQPFAIDKLPSAWRDRIVALRAKWLTWEQIEEETKNFEWAKLEESDAELALSHFADRRIPHTTLHSWYDVRIQQEMGEMEKERQASEAIAARLGAEGYEGLDETVRNALVDVTLSRRGNPEDFRVALLDLSLKLTRDKRTEIAKERVDLDRKKLEEFIRKADKSTNEAAKKIGKGGKLTIDDINRLRERTFGLPPLKREPAAGPAA
jgi:hypothetical protein